MNRLFKLGEMLSVPDGTSVSPFLNPLDSNQKGPSPQSLTGVSIAVGQIDPGVQSKIHIHPFVSQTTWVIDGNLQVKMKEQRAGEVYSLSLGPKQAVFTEALTFLQLMNLSESKPVRALYTVSPAYVFDPENSYDDAHVLGLSWAALDERDWRVAALGDLPGLAKRREISVRPSRIARKIEAFDPYL